MVALELLLVIGVPVAPDSQNSGGCFVEGNHVGQRHVSVVIVAVLVVFDHQVDVHLKQLVPVIGLGAEAQLLRDLLLDLVEGVGRLANIGVTVEPVTLQLLQLVRGLPHHMGDTSSDFQAGRAIGNNDVIRRDVHRNLATE